MGMSEEAKAKISAAVKANWAKKKAEQELILSEPEVLDIVPECVKMVDQVFDPILFQPIKTGKPIDQLLSTRGGFPRATNFMMVGDPGVGKSTVAMDILSDLQATGASVLFVSADGS